MYHEHWHISPSISDVWDVPLRWTTIQTSNYMGDRWARSNSPPSFCNLANVLQQALGKVRGHVVPSAPHPKEHNSVQKASQRARSHKKTQRKTLPSKTKQETNPSTHKPYVVGRYWTPPPIQIPKNRSYQFHPNPFEPSFCHQAWSTGLCSPERSRLRFSPQGSMDAMFWFFCFFAALCHLRLRQFQLTKLLILPPGKRVPETTSPEWRSVGWLVVCLVGWVWFGLGWVGWLVGLDLGVFFNICFVHVRGFVMLHVSLGNLSVIAGDCRILLSYYMESYIYFAYRFHVLIMPLVHF